MTVLHDLYKADIPPCKLALHWFGQSSFTVKISGQTIVLIDPFFPLHRPVSEHESLLKPIRDLLPKTGVLATHPEEGEFPFFVDTCSIAENVWELITSY